MKSKSIHFIGNYIDFHFSNGVGFVSYNIHTLNIDSAKKMVKERDQVMSELDKSVPVLFNMRNLISVDDESMNYLSQKSVVQKKINAGAYLISNELNAMTFNIWKQLKPPIPCKAFSATEKEKAIAWLRQMANDSD